LDNKVLKCVFMGTPEFAVPVLRRLHTDGYRIVAVISQPDRPQGRKRAVEPTPVKKAALEFGLDVYQPASLREKSCVQLLQDLTPDVIVVAAYGNLLTKEVLEIPRLGCINVHASLLPDLRGAAPIQFALLRGYPKTGISIMQMEVGLDSGPVYAQKAIEITEEDDVRSLSLKLSNLGAELCAEVISNLVEGKLELIPQDETGVSYAPKIGRSDEIIDWTRSAEEIHNHIRAMSPIPGAMTQIETKNLKIYRSSVIQFDGVTAALPGEIVKINKDGITVACGLGFINILDLQLAGKKRLPVAAFVSGDVLKIGQHFERKSMVADEA